MLQSGFMRTGAILVFLIPAVALSADAVTLKIIMQELRDNTMEIADGLLTDDLDRVVAGATGISNHPQISPEQVQLVAAELGSEMPAFKQLDTQVHDLSIEIRNAATAGDSGAASSSFQQMIDGCLGCHRTYKARVAAVLNPDAGLQ